MDLPAAQHPLVPAQAGTQDKLRSLHKLLDSRLRGNERGMRA